MSLCPSRRCSCTITSSSLSVTGKVGGVGYNIETYEGVGTEVPDTRPAPGTRFDGMRVWTTDTKRLWAWDDAAGFWRLLSEPRQTWVPVLTQGNTLSTTKTSAWFQRQSGTWMAVTRLEIDTAGTSNQFFTLTYPQELAEINDAAGQFWYFDAGTQSHTGVLASHTTLATQFMVNGTTSRFGATPAVTAATVDHIVVGMTGTYDEAAL